MDHQPLPRLSHRQLQCLQGVADHLDSEQIAERLNIRPRTVDNHLAAAMAALGAHTRRDAVRKWLERDRCSQRTSTQLPSEFVPMDFPTANSPIEGGSTVRESPAPLSFHDEPLAHFDRRGEYDERPKSALKIVAIIAGLAAAIAILLLAAPQLGQDAQSLANFIQPYHQRK